MTKPSVIEDLSNPLRGVRETLVLLQNHLQLLRTVAHRRATDHIVYLTQAGDDERLLQAISKRQQAIESLYEGVSHALARLVEARAHLALASQACAVLAEEVHPSDPQTAS